MTVFTYLNLSEKQINYIHAIMFVLLCASIITAAMLHKYRHDYDVKWAKDNNYIPSKSEAFADSQRGKSLFILSSLCICFQLVYAIHYGYNQHKLTGIHKVNGPKNSFEEW